MGYRALIFLGFSFLSIQLDCSATWPATTEERCLMLAFCSVADARLPVEAMMVVDTDSEMGVERGSKEIFPFKTR